MGKVLSVRSVLGSQIDIIMALHADSLKEIGDVVRDQIGEFDGVLKTTTLMCSPSDPDVNDRDELEPTAYILIETRPGRSMILMIERLRSIEF